MSNQMSRGVRVAAVAAAVAVNVQKSHVAAAIPNAINITAGGTLTVKSVNNTDGSATTNATAVRRRSNQR